MTKKIILFVALFTTQLPCYGQDLIQAYQQALASDPTYQQAIAQRLSDKENLPIAISTLLPSIAGSAVPSLTRSTFSGNTTARKNTARGYTVSLTATQTLFDFKKFFTVASVAAFSKQADAQLNAALQDLILRLANAYFTVLKDEDTLTYNEAAKKAFLQQLNQVKQQYDVGLKTITDVYTAQASYDAAVADNIAAATQLENDKENLRVITGQHYPVLATLSEKFPLVKPAPAHMETWVEIAKQQNWSIRAAQYGAEQALHHIHTQVSGHLPTAQVEASIDKTHLHNTNRSNNDFLQSGSSNQIDKTISLQINVPIFEGGLVIAETHQAQYGYQVSRQILEKTLRDTINLARQSYLGVISGISKIKADQQAMRSAISSLKGIKAGYNVGTETLVDVLDQQQKVYETQTQYATDRYAYINHLLTLKQAAGTLSITDLCAINRWLMVKSQKKQ